MSTQVTTAFVKQFSANVFHLSQQKESRLKPLVRNETQQSKAAFWDRIGTVTAQKKTTRHGDTPQIDTPHSRRRVTLVDYEHGDLVDEADRLRLLQDPASQYTVAFSRALGRAIDDEIILAFGGDAFGGEEGSTTVPLVTGNPAKSQRLFSTNTAGTARDNLNVKALQRAKKRLDENEVDPSEPRHWCASSSQIDSLLDDSNVTSSDFNTVKALVRGEVDAYMGFTFTRSQRLPLLAANITTGDFTTGETTGGADTLTAATENHRKNYAWAEEGMMLATAQDMKVRVAERADKAFSTQVFASMSIGATRLEEEKVIEMLAAEL